MPDVTRPDRRAPRPGPAPALDLRRAAGRRRALRAGAARPLRAGRADRGVGAEHPRVGDPRVRRGAGRADPGHRQPGIQAGRAQVRARAVRLGRDLPAARVPRQPDGRSRSQTVRGELPALREAIGFDEFDAFLASGAPTSRCRDVQPGDPVQIQYTSGTTGFPKGALLHHRGLTNNARLTLGSFGLQPGEVLLNPFPLFHTAGCGLGVLGCVSHRLAHVPVLAFEPGLMLDLAESGAGRGRCWACRRC